MRLQRFPIQRRALLRGCMLLPLLICIIAIASTLWYMLSVRASDTSFFTAKKDLHEAFKDMQLRIALLAPQLRNASLPPTAQTLLLENVFSSPVSYMDEGSSGTSTAGHAYKGYKVEAVYCNWKTAGKDIPDQKSTVHLLAFFIHGNAGDGNQGVRWSCSLQYLAKSRGWRVDTYIFSLANQANVHRGRLLKSQAGYVVKVVESLVRRHKQQQEGQHQAAASSTFITWIAGHSMGGIVARVVAKTLNPSIALSGLLTFNSPNRYPPLFFDRPMAHLYKSLVVSEHQQLSSALWQKGSKAPTGDSLSSSKMGLPITPFNLTSSIKTAFISLTSGAMDLQIESSSTYINLTGSRYRGAFYNTADSQICGVSASHDGILTSACPLAFAALQVAHESDLLLPPEERMGSLLNASALQMQQSSGGLLQLSASPLHLAQSLGRYLYTRHVWPLAISSFYLFLILHALRPLLRACLRSNGAVPTRRASRLQWAIGAGHVMLHNEAVGCVGLFYTTTLLYSLCVYVVLRLFGGFGSFAVVLPWQVDVYPQLHEASRHGILILPFALRCSLFCVATAGPVFSGAALGWMTSASLNYFLSHRCFFRRWPADRFSGLQERGVRLILLVLLLVGVGGGVLISIFLLSATSRAFALLIATLLCSGQWSAATRAVDSDIETEMRTLNSDSVDMTAVVIGGTAAPPPRRWGSHGSTSFMLFALLYFLQLQPFFTLRNAIVSRTFDDSTTLDPMNGVVELLLAVATAVHAAAMHWAKVIPPPPLYLPFAFTCLAAAAVAFLITSPIEVCNVLPTMLGCLPGLLYIAVYGNSEAGGNKG